MVHRSLTLLYTITLVNTAVISDIGMPCLSTANLNVRKSHQHPADFSKAAVLEVYQLRHIDNQQANTGVYQLVYQPRLTG